VSETEFSIRPQSHTDYLITEVDESPICSPQNRLDPISGNIENYRNIKQNTQSKRAPIEKSEMTNLI
jgi:hypothetical protein